MNHGTRTTLFFLFVAFFLVTTPLVIAYSQGYRLDWENRTIVQTGALFMEARPAPVELFLDGKLNKRSNFVFQNIFVGNLLPKTHLVKVKKEGYATWSKNLAVYPKLVTELKNITLFPEKKGVSNIARDVNEFSISPDKKYIALYRKTSTTSTLALYLQKTFTEKIVFEAPTSNAHLAKMEEMSWNKDASRLLFALKNDQDKEWYTLNKPDTNPQVTNISYDILNLNEFKQYTQKLSWPQIDLMQWNPGNPAEAFFVASDNSKKIALLFRYGIEKGEVSKPLAYDVSTYVIKGAKIFYISSLARSVNSLDIYTGKTEQISFYPLAEGARSIKFLDTQKLIIHADDEVYVYKESYGVFEKIAGGVKTALPSSGEKKLLLVGKEGISVYWLEDVHTQPFHDAGEHEKIFRQEQAILSTAWFTNTNEHVIFSDTNALRVIELDKRDKRNISNLSALPAEQLQYVEQEGTIYFLAGTTLNSIVIR